MNTHFCNLCREDTLYKAWNYVKSKGSAGGIDGVTIEDFNKDKEHQIRIIQAELKNGTWKPQPYLQIAIPKSKDPNEKRILGMAVVKDKVIQQAVRQIIEPRLERLFLPNSFAYRQGKGALKTIRYVIKQCGNTEYKYSLRLDVDNFFDEIDHEILQKRLTAIGVEDEIVRLIMLSVKMGRVEVSGIWNEPTKGIPQGAVLSPLLANLYLHSFDQFDASNDLPMFKGLLTDETRQLLVKSVMERLARYEKYQGEEMKMEQIILRQAKLLAKAFDGTEEFKPYVAKW